MGLNDSSQKTAAVWRAMYDNDLGTCDLEFPRYVEELNSYASYFEQKGADSGEGEVSRLWELFRQDPSADRDGFVWYLSDYREAKEKSEFTAEQEKEYWHQWSIEGEGEIRQGLTFPRYVEQRYRYGRFPVAPVGA